MCALVSIPSARELADVLIGFANAEGGTVVVGLWNGVVEGIDRQGSGRLSGWQQAVIDFTAPRRWTAPRSTDSYRRLA